MAKRGFNLFRGLKKRVYKEAAAPAIAGRAAQRETFIYYLDPVILEEKHEHKKRFSSNRRPNKVYRMASIRKGRSGKGLCRKISGREPKIRRGQVLYSLWSIGIYEEDNV